MTAPRRSCNPPRPADPCSAQQQEGGHSVAIAERMPQTQRAEPPWQMQERHRQIFLRVLADQLGSDIAVVMGSSTAAPVHADLAGATVRGRGG